MRWLRIVTILLAVLMAPAAAVASGPSAGNQQYTDPLAGSTTPTPPSGSHGSSAGSPGAPAARSAPSAASAPATSSAPGIVQTTSPSSAIPDATGSPSTSSATASAHTLPTTGYELWVGAVLGAGLLSGGLAIRRQSRGI
jgi:hypothetical protein